MDQTTKEQILRLIADAQAAYDYALLPENKKDFGYAYSTGYLKSALRSIREIVMVEE